MEETLKIAVIDECPLMLDGLKLALDDVPDFQVVGQGTTAAEALEIAQSLNPELMIIDTRSGTSGLMMMEEVAAACPSIKFIVMSEEAEGDDSDESAPLPAALTHMSKKVTRKQLERTVRSAALS